MDTQTRLIINELTKKRKKVEKELTKTTKKLNILNYFIKLDSLGYRMSKGAILAGVLSIGLFITAATINSPIIGAVLASLGGVVSVVSIVGHTYTNYVIQDKLKEKQERLAKERIEILKNLECVRNGEEYIPPAPEKTPEQKLIELAEQMRRFSEEYRRQKRQELLQKAKECGFDVDRILNNPDSYATKKEYITAKKELCEFLEEENARRTEYKRNGRDGR